MSFKLLISERRIKQKLKKIGKKLEQDYRGEEVTIVMVMKGALCLAADLIRSIDFPVKIEYISASSYGARGTERGELVIKGLEDIPAKDQHILIVDDVFQSGHTLFRLESAFKKSAKSVKSLVLLYKDIPRDIDYEPDYYCFKVGDPFVIGYGMDYKELYRGLRGIYIMQSEDGK
jgi:hypoxanthine phosphoribosyltransferase